MKRYLIDFNFISFLHIPKFPRPLLFFILFYDIMYSLMNNLASSICARGEFQRGISLSLSVSASRQRDSLLLLSILRPSILPSKSVKLNPYITEMALETALHVPWWMSNQDSYSAEDPTIVTLFCFDIKRNSLCFHHVPVSMGPHLALSISVILIDSLSEWVSEWMLMPKIPCWIQSLCPCAEPFLTVILANHLNNNY